MPTPARGIYSETVWDHFQHPRHVGCLDPADGRALVGDPDCGDFLELTLRLSADHQRLEEVAFRIKGCPAAIATASVAVERAYGGTVEEVLAITEQDIVADLDGLPEAKIHCSLLAVRALQAALQQALIKRLYLKGGLVASAEEFDRRWESGEIAASLGLSCQACDGRCEEDAGPSETSGGPVEPASPLCSTVNASSKTKERTRRRRK